MRLSARCSDGWTVGRGSQGRMKRGTCPAGHWSRHRPGVVALVIGGFGLAVLAIVVSSLRRAVANAGAGPLVEGRVLSAKVEKYRESVSPCTGGARDRMTLYRPVLLYSRTRWRENVSVGADCAKSGAGPWRAGVCAEGGRPFSVRKRGGRCATTRRWPGLIVAGTAGAPGSWIFGAAIGVALLVLAAYTYHRGR